MSVIRSLLIVVGMIAVNRGVIDQAQVDMAIGVVVTLLSMIWGVADKYRTHRKQRDALQAIASVQEGQKP